jgi:putative transposase
MDLTQEQISESLQELANKEYGFNSIMKMTLEALMKAERTIFQDENGVSANGFRSRRIQGFSHEIALSVPRTREGNFYPVLLSVIKAENEERFTLFSSLYRKGLTTAQIGDISDEVYGKHYSKSQVSFLMKEAKQETEIWLERPIDEHYLALFIDATFVSTRRDDKVSKEGYYTILAVKGDGTREVLSVINHPTEGAGLWHLEFEALKARGLKSVGLVVSDGLNSIENSVAKSFPGASHQLCVVHFKRNITQVFPYKQRKEINEELKHVFPVETGECTPIEGFKRLEEFVQKWENKYPALKTFKKERSIFYFTYLQFPSKIQRMIYTTNWIERLNKDYKRTLKMRGAMPSSKSVLFLIGSVAMERTAVCYSYPIVAFRDIDQLQQQKSDPIQVIELE